MGNDPDQPKFVKNWTYFGYLFDLIKQFDEIAWMHVLTEVRLAQRSGPSFPELVPVGGDVFRFVIDSFSGERAGLIVVVDFQMDSNGHVEPVMGGANQDLF